MISKPQYAFIASFRRDRRTYLHTRGFFHLRLQSLNPKKLSLKAKQSQIGPTVNAIQRARSKERLEATVVVHAVRPIYHVSQDNANVGRPINHVQTW